MVEFASKYFRGYPNKWAFIIKQNQVILDVYYMYLHEECQSCINLYLFVHGIVLKKKVK